MPLVLGRSDLSAPGSLATLDRFGLAFYAGFGALEEYPLERLPFGWYADWTFRRDPARPGGVEYVQILPVDQRYPPNWEAVREAVWANKGALWIVGNEPECVHQGNRTPEEYAEIYHDYYVFLKEHDPWCRVAIGGIVQPTPLRLEWLDRVLSHYEARYGQPMPVDVWNIHNQILQEKRERYGCEIPAGLDADEGMIYPWWENDSTQHFVDHVWAFRRWMADHGQREKPLIISEYGVLYPSHWFDTLAGPAGDLRVIAFMEATFDFMLRATDPEIGCPTDGDRLVQRWAWLSLNSPTWRQDPINGFNGHLCDPYTHELAVFGEHYEALLERILSEQP